MTAPPASLPRRLLRGLLAVPAALWMVLEEWLWDGLVALTRWVARLPIFRRLEVAIGRLRPYPAMALFLVPWLALLPAKLLSFWLIGTGRPKLGITVFVVAKVVGTAILARLFTLTRPALLQIGWFARVYHWFTALRDRLYAYVRSLRAYQLARAWLARIRSALVSAWRSLRGR